MEAQHHETCQAKCVTALYYVPRHWDASTAQLRTTPWRRTGAWRYSYTHS